MQKNLSVIACRDDFILYNLNDLQAESGLNGLLEKFRRLYWINCHLWRLLHAILSPELSKVCSLELCRSIR